MQTSEFHFELPEELIAKYPAEERTSSRLLKLEKDKGTLTDGAFRDVLNYVGPGDLLVLNNTKVLPARLFGRKVSGGKVEVLVERIKNKHSVLAQVFSSKIPKPGNILLVGKQEKYRLVVLGRSGTFFEIGFDTEKTVLEVLNDIGHIPLPPYIGRPGVAVDEERYQTVYRLRPGAVAAPTAGLHFDTALIREIEGKGVTIAYVTLHVGAGSFRPVRVNEVKDHRMHSEYVRVTQDVVRAVLDTKKKGRKVIAVGTTSVRSLETAAQHALEQGNKFGTFFGDTEIFIYPGYEYQVVDCLITNFHLPRSTLIMLVSAFAGHENTMAAYRHAIRKKYRFFSYGDAMFIER